MRISLCEGHRFLHCPQILQFLICLHGMHRDNFTYIHRSKRRCSKTGHRCNSVYTKSVSGIAAFCSATDSFRYEVCPDASGLKTMIICPCFDDVPAVLICSLEWQEADCDVMCSGAGKKWLFSIWRLVTWIRLEVLRIPAENTCRDRRCSEWELNTKLHRTIRCFRLGVT
jgi:hypothetical protein